jgi:hypothetical protein
LYLNCGIISGGGGKLCLGICPQRYSTSRRGNMGISQIHDRLGNTAIIYVAILAVWAFWRFIRKEGLDSSYWGALVIGEALILATGAIGLYMWIAGLRPDRGIHILYGVISAVGIPLIFTYTRGRESRSTSAVYGSGLLFLAALMLRAVATGA